MWIVEIKRNENGSYNDHRADYITVVPEGWARIPEEMRLENFPFGEAAIEEVEGVMTVVGWIPGVMPEPEPERAPAMPLSDSELADAILNGINEI